MNKLKHCTRNLCDDILSNLENAQHHLSFSAGVTCVKHEEERTLTISIRPHKAQAPHLTCVEVTKNGGFLG